MIIWLYNLYVNIYVSVDAPGIRGEMYAGRLDKTYVKVIVNAGQRISISKNINQLYKSQNVQTS